MWHVCDFGAIDESMVHDRIIVGSGLNDYTRRCKLLQIRDLTLNKAIDICKASEVAAKQLQVITNDEQIQLLRKSRRVQSGLTGPVGEQRPNLSTVQCCNKQYRIATCDTILMYCDNSSILCRTNCDTIISK